MQAYASTSALRAKSCKLSIPPCIRRSKHTTTSQARVRADLRNLLRDTAQPVAVVTSLMPVWDPSHASHPSTAPPPPHAHPHRLEDDLEAQLHAKFHGATLSSFSSIAMDPHPLIAFSLRIPSRMAMTLKNVHPPYQSSSSSSPNTPTPSPTSNTHPHNPHNPLKDLPTHLVINVLSSTQSHIATTFSRADLHPYPFTSIPYHLTAEGLPVLKGCLGALSCRLVAASWPLHDLESLKLGGGGGGGEGGGWEGEGVASELFIGQVVRVEDVDRLGEIGKEGGGESEERQRRTPLLYYQRRYTTTDTRDLPDNTARNDN